MLGFGTHATSNFLWAQKREFIFAVLGPHIFFVHPLKSLFLCFTMIRVCQSIMNNSPPAFALALVCMREGGCGDVKLYLGVAEKLYT